MDRDFGIQPLRPRSVQALRHHSFILSLWLEGGPLPHSPPVWRISLEDPHSSERRGFKDLAELLRYLEGWTAVPPSEESAIEK